MSDDSGVLFVGSRPRKIKGLEVQLTPDSTFQRTHRETSEVSSGRPSGEPSSSSLSATPGPSLPPLRRYPGDGLDLRRPATTQPSEDVIDLTDEPDTPYQNSSLQESRTTNEASRPRPPRFPRDILTEVVDLEEEVDDNDQQQPPSSPEVEFIGATVRRPQLPPPPQPPPPPPPRSNEGFYMPSLWQQMLQFRSPRPPVRVGDHGRPDLAFRGFRRHPPISDVESFWIGDGPAGAIDLTINLDVDGPLGLDYQLTGLTRQRTPANAYKPPSPPPEGFTRNVAEDDVVVCPNCDMELGTGDETKQQIWVVKQCGHVYCGDCASNRSLSKAKKNASKAKPFSKCQVFGCGKPVSSPKSMFQIYL
ncbi:putative RING finger domain protein [Aspergillus neoniger CBS 115656]|uniref:RING finger domain protein n=1 Tax=Aspergillus neoniger (strain CBS 115656) TaxID=1448310 RepID=A0A318Z4I0_ASPNB|nr:RING finger domain protein [Aspergillus neoniger CBS 115656]PYH31842.1 RING finger domain protein [Aspergillus neoniger CBS 115656]